MNFCYLNVTLTSQNLHDWKSEHRKVCREFCLRFNNIFSRCEDWRLFYKTGYIQLQGKSWLFPADVSFPFDKVPVISARPRDMIQDPLCTTSAFQTALLSNPRISNHKNPWTSTVANNVGEMGWACSITGIWEGQRIVAGRRKGKRPTGTEGHGCKDNITVHTTEIMFEGTKWVKAAQACV